MYLNSSQSLDSSVPHIRDGKAISPRLQPQPSPAQPVDFTDRQLEAYFLPHPQNPSTYLQGLYTAIRTQMVLDGCA
jgi:hypothetical protein